MRLIDVISATHTATAGVIDLVVIANLGRGEETIPFTYSPADPHGLAPLAREWLVSHPGFPIGAYEAPEPAPVDLYTERERRIALPLTVSVPSGAQFPINMDEKAQRNLQGLASVGQYLVVASPTQATSFRDYNNHMQTLLPSDLVAMGLQVAARIQACYAAEWALKAMSPIPTDFRDDSYWA